MKDNNIKKMEKSITIIPGYVAGISSRKDRTWRITLETQELTPDLVASAMQLMNKYGFVAFKEAEFQHDEETSLDEIDMDLGGGGKSPSQRLRNVFYVLWKKENKGFKSFKDYYAHRMENVIDFYKEKIDK